VLVRELEDASLVIVSPQGEELARHQLAVGTNQRIIVPAHYAALRPPSIQTRPAVHGHEPPVRVAAPPGAAVVPDAPRVEVRPLADYDRLVGVAL
jgi:hypothetical protein